MVQVDARKPDFARRAAEDRKYYVKMKNLDDFGPILGGDPFRRLREVFLDGRSAIGSAHLEPQGQIVR